MFVPSYSSVLEKDLDWAWSGSVFLPLGLFFQEHIKPHKAYGFGFPPLEAVAQILLLAPGRLAHCYLYLKKAAENERDGFCLLGLQRRL